MRSRHVPWLVILVGVVLLVFRPSGDDTNRSGGGGGEGKSYAPGSKLDGRVVKITDGDTIHVRLDGGTEEKVRYIGMDTPETHKPNTPVQCFGVKASERNAQLVSGRQVELTVGEEPRDRYGRLLAYVHRRPDGLFVNAELVAQGYARTLTIPPNDRYAPEFANLAAKARQAGRGLWSAC